MLLRTSDWAVALLLASSAQAFKNASPFFLLASHPLNTTTTLRSSQVSSAKLVEDALLGSSFARGCNADVILIRQSGLHVKDLQEMSKVRSRVEDIKKLPGSTVIEIPEVVGAVDITRVQQEFTTKCGAEKVIVMDSKADARSLRDTESTLAATLQSRTAPGKPYLVVFTGSGSASADTPPYEFEDSHPELHTDLKRNLGEEGAVRQQAAGKGDSQQTNLPLFETYQFLTPGIFMGLSISLILVVILYVGISAISGLEVSYAAFSKEMGPQAQKKQQ